jgi:hypothetical protein
VLNYNIERKLFTLTCFIRVFSLLSVWKDNVEMDVGGTDLEGVDWTYLPQDGEHQAVVNMVLHLQVP